MIPTNYWPERALIQIHSCLLVREHFSVFPRLPLCVESHFDLLCPSRLSSLSPLLRPSFSLAAMSHLLSLQFMNPLALPSLYPVFFSPPPYPSAQHHLCAVIQLRYSCLLYRGFSWLSSFSLVNRTNRSSFDQIILQLTPGFHHSCVVIPTADCLFQSLTFPKILWCGILF